MVPVKFSSGYAQYNPGEEAAFAPELARSLIDRKLAAYVPSAPVQKSADAAAAGAVAGVEVREDSDVTPPGGVSVPPLPLGETVPVDEAAIVGGRVATRKKK